MRNVFLALLMPVSCLAETTPAIVKTQSGILPDHRPVHTFTLSHPSGISATVSELGATLQSLHVPNSSGKAADILIGHDSFEKWRENSSFLGSTIGRFANRIARGKFTLDGKEYQLATNNGPNHLHGGPQGFHKVLWSGEQTGDYSIRLTYLSPDGEEGYPGNLRVTVDYILAENSLTWRATATTDAPTLVNLTNHAYFNLSGDPTTPILGHLLTIHAEHYLPVDEGLIPTGEIAPVKGTPFDFTKPKPIGRDIEKAGGYDHCFVLPASPKPRLAATLEEPKSGRSMRLHSDQPGLQLYTATRMSGGRQGLCLEPQHLPDSPNQAAFPSPVLRPGETYSHTLVLEFPKP